MLSYCIPLMCTRSISQYKLVLFLFAHLLTYKNSTIFYGATLLASILHLPFSKVLCIFESHYAKQKSEICNSIRIIFKKIIVIIKINFIKFFSKNMSLISNKCNFIKIFIIKEYIIISV